MRDKAPLEGQELEYTDISPGDTTDWLQLARSAYEASTDYLNANHRKQFEKNLANFMSRHPDGSKYYLDSYKNRSKLFRPKTRIACRKNEAAFAAAMFSADDIVVLEPENENDPAKRRDARFWHYILNYRLSKTIPWFMLSIGAFQEAMVYGVVISKQYWDYQEEQTGEEMAVDPYGQPMLDETGQPVILPTTQAKTNEPKIRLLEVENFRFDPAADWIDPISTSPYLIELMPMYVGDVLDRMGQIDDKTGRPMWQPMSKAEIIAAGKSSDADEDTTRKAREGGQEPEADHFISDFEIVWVHENIIRQNGEDYIFYTLGTQKMLSEPVPLKDVYPAGRPFVRGVCVIEAHRPIPSGTVQLTEQLQAEVNDTVNQRRDNVVLALNRRKRVLREANVDLHALLRDVPGGIVLTDDIHGIADEVVPDVTASAYHEQNRMDADFDDIAGVFSTSSVQTNRQLGETVGGMELMSQFANKESEYLIRTFVETWVEPVLRQLVVLEQYYEEDEHLIETALKNVEAKEAQLAGQGSLPPSPSPPSAPQSLPLEKPQKVDVRVNVGFGNLNPDQRIAKVLKGIQALASIAPWTAAKLNVEEVAKEIFGAMGHKSGSRFFTDFNPPDGTNGVEAQKLKLEEMKLAEKAKYNEAKLAIDRELGMAKIAAQENLTLKQLAAKLGIESQKIEVAKRKAGVDNLTRLAEIERKKEELAFKDRTGRQGI